MLSASRGARFCTRMRSLGGDQAVGPRYRFSVIRIDQLVEGLAILLRKRSLTILVQQLLSAATPMLITGRGSLRYAHQFQKKGQELLHRHTSLGRSLCELIVHRIGQGEILAHEK